MIAGLGVMTSSLADTPFALFSWALWQMSSLHAGYTNASSKPHTGKIRIG